MVRAASASSTTSRILKQVESGLLVSVPLMVTASVAVAQDSELAQETSWRETAFSFVSENWVVSILAVAVLVGMVTGIWNRLPARNKVYSFYIVLPLLVLSWSAVTRSGAFLYFIVFMLGMATAFAEIIQKFRGEPLEALSTWQALLYHVFNGVIAALALNLLLAVGVAAEAPLDQIKIVVTAGLGSMLVMRSKLFSVKVGDETIAVGPEQMINIFLGYLEHEIDRVRSVARIEFVRKQMSNLKFSAITAYSETMLYAAQALGDKRQKIEGEIGKIETSGPTDEELRSYRLGFLLLTEMGNDFVRELYENPKPEWLLKAPKAPEEEQAAGFLPSLFQRRKFVLLCTPSDRESRERLAQQLGWPLAELEKHVENTGHLEEVGVVRATAEGGLPALTEDPSGSAEVVVYKLPEETVKFLEQRHPEVRLGPVQVVMTPSEGKKKGKPLDGVAFFRSKGDDEPTPQTKEEDG